MFHQSESGPAHQPASAIQRSIPLPPADQSVLRMFMLGDISTLNRMVGRLAANGIADAKHWSEPQPTGRTGEYITVHTKRMRADRV